MERISVEIVLPCGCTISHAAVVQGDYDISSLASIEKRLQHQAKVLAHWFHQRITLQNRHRCELVSVGNPNGFTIRTDRHEKPSTPSLPQEGLPPSG